MKFKIGDRVVCVDCFSKRLIDAGIVCGFKHGNCLVKYDSDGKIICSSISTLIFERKKSNHPHTKIFE